MTSTKLAIVTELSSNLKTGPMSATYTGYQTCPDSCALKPTIEQDGSFERDKCYASCDLVGMHMHRLTYASVAADLVQIQEQECAGIDKLSGENILRLKVGGDTPDARYANGLAIACKGFTAKHNQPAYGYTHNWENIPRDAFGDISILASCDELSDIATAKSMGYATATIVSEFPRGAKVFQLAGENILPCPEQVASAQIEAGMRTKEQKIQCTDCLLCTKDKLLRERNLTIGFIAHSRLAEQLKAMLRAKGA